MFMDNVRFFRNIYDNDDIMSCNWDKPASRNHVGSLFFVHHHIYCGKHIEAEV